MADWYPSVLVVLSLVSLGQSEVNTDALRDQVQHLTNDILGVKSYQSYLDRDVTYSSSKSTANDFIDQLSRDLSKKINERVTAVRNLQEVVQNEFTNFDQKTKFDNCCQCCKASDDYGKLRFHKEVDTSTMCHTGEGTSTGSRQRYPNSKVLEVMKQNMEDNPSLKYQYFGGEDGIMTIYPSNKHCDQTYDPRYRLWYSHTAFPVPKDMVIVIDKSGSMGRYERNQILMDIAKEAASTVIDTLSPGDRVGVVYFSDDVNTKSGSCHTDQLAYATSENKNTLKQYVSDAEPKGNTFYGKPFKKAFSLFSESKPTQDTKSRAQVILFLTDGEPVDTNYTDIIKAENAKLQNKIIIMTFGFGNDITSKEEAILTNIANQKGADTTAGNITKGRFVHVHNPKNLRYSMARYYDFFSDEENTDEVVVAVPYFDAFGLGLITSTCLPVHTDNTFRGVVCIDMTLSDLFSDAVYFSQNTLSYAFIMDSHTRLLTHPLLPRPDDVYDEPTILRVFDVEDDPNMKNIVKNFMLKGLAGSETFSSRRVVSRGDTEHDGVDSIQMDSTYSWKPVGFGNLTVCVVLANKDQHRTITDARYNNGNGFPYHRLDITKPSNSCRHINRIAITDTSAIKLSPFAFKSPDRYLETTETNQMIERYGQYFAGTNEASFRDGVKEAVAISNAFDEAISKTDDAWQSALWRYLVLREGVLRLYPGTKFVKKYDPTIRPWYKRALAQSDLISFSKPYVDAFGAGIIVTLSKAVHEGRSSGVHQIDDPPAGAMAMDFTLDLFNSLINKHVPQCLKHNCFVIDNGGYIISHPDFELINEKNFMDIENIHITQKESGVAAILAGNKAKVLAKDGCINYEKKYVQSFWRVTKGTYSGQGIELCEVEGTNIFIIVKDKSVKSNSISCTCSVSKGLHIPECKQRSTACECPCYSRSQINFDVCSSSFSFDREMGNLPPCTPVAPVLNLTSVATEEQTAVGKLEYCYPVKTVCPKCKQQLNCSATAGCRWCGGRCTVRTDSMKSCPGGKNVAAIIIPLLVILVVLGIVLVVLWRKGILPGKSSSRGASRTPASERPVNLQPMAENQGGDLTRVTSATNEPYEDPPPTYGEAIRCLEDRK